MKKIINNIKKDKLVTFCVNFNIIFFVLGLIIVLGSLKFIPNYIPIFNQLPWGDARLGNKLDFFIPLGLSILIFLLNVKISTYFQEINILFFRFCFLISTIFSLFTLILITRIVFLIK